MPNGQVIEALTADTAAAVAPMLEAVAQRPAVQAARAEVERLTREIATWRARRAVVTTAEVATAERITGLREARTALLMAQLAGEAIDEAQLATSTTDLFAATLALEDAATTGRLSDERLRALEADRDTAAREAARVEVEALETIAEAQARTADAQLADACASAAVYVVLHARIARLAQEYGGQGLRHPRGQVEAAVAHAFRPIFSVGGHGAMPLAAANRTTPRATPFMDALEAEQQRQAALEPVGAASEGDVVAPDGWTRRG